MAENLPAQPTESTENQLSSGTQGIQDRPPISIQLYQFVSSHPRHARSLLALLVGPVDDPQCGCQVMQDATFVETCR